MLTPEALLTLSFSLFTKFVFHFSVHLAVNQIYKANAHTERDFSQTDLSENFDTFNFPIQFRDRDRVCRSLASSTEK